MVVVEREVRVGYLMETDCSSINYFTSGSFSNLLRKTIVELTNSESAR